MDNPIDDPLDVAARLLADHGSMLAEGDHLDRDAEVAERITWAWGQMSIVDRCAGAIGRTVLVEVHGVGWTEGELAGVGSDWVEVRTVRGADVVATRHIEGIVGVQGASRLPADVPKTEKSHDLRQWLRRHVDVNDRLEFLQTRGSHITGRPVRVGADHVDVELPDGQPLCLALARIALIRVV